MIRRFSAALIGLALCLPVFAVPVAAHTSAGIVVSEVGTYTDLAGDTHVTGLVTNHTQNRRSNIQVTATWTTPTAGTETATAFVTNLAPHTTAPFEIIEEDTDVSGSGTPAVAATGSLTGTRPVGGLEIDRDTDALVANVYTVTITNESSVAGEDIRVYALRHGGSQDDAAQSDEAIDLAPGASAEFTITFDPLSEGEDIAGVVAKTNAGANFLTSWNNFFSDLGTSNFMDAIAFMADEGITTGCGNANFCPKDNVTRAQMAVFLDRALGLTDAPDQGFQDISGLSADFQQAINNIAAAGITGGCSTTPKNYCPSQIVTRGQMSKFIVAAYNLGDPTTAWVDSFSDDDGHFSEKYNDRMAELGITTGCGATTYCPNSPVLREQMAVFIFRAEQLPS